MKIMSLRNGGDFGKQFVHGLVVYWITLIPSWHNFHITETQFTILYIINIHKNDFLRYLTICSITTGVRELNVNSQISLASHNSKHEMREI